MRISSSACARVVLLAALLAPAAGAEPVSVTRDALAGDSIKLAERWRYHPGDDPAWADPRLDDSAWEIVDSPRMDGGERPPGGWPGIGWFRLRLQVDPALAGPPVAHVFTHPGASEVYVDGRPVRAFGRVSASADEERTYDPKRLALRYSCARGADGVMSLERALTGGNLPVGFCAWLDDAECSMFDRSRGLLFNGIVTTAFICVLATSRDPPPLPVPLRPPRARELLLQPVRTQLRAQRHVRLSAAGMPPALIFRAATGRSRRSRSAGCRSGAGCSRTRSASSSSRPATRWVFMSDGVPERFNATGEMLEYNRAREVLAEAARGPAHAIIEHFVRTGDAWADGHPHDDDVTFVVVKARENGGG